MSNGLIIKDNSKTVFDSKNSHLLVDLKANPKHFDIIDIVCSPTFVATGATVKTTILTIPHKLRYTPTVDGYFFPAGANPLNPDQYFQNDGTYYHNYFSFVSVSGVGPTDRVEIRVDGQFLKVIYTVKALFADYTSAPFPLKLKYLIFSNEGYAELV